jgi:hypothetical protein
MASVFAGPLCVGLSDTSDRLSLPRLEGRGCEGRFIAVAGRQPTPGSQPASPHPKKTDLADEGALLDLQETRTAPAPRLVFLVFHL